VGQVRTFPSTIHGAKGYIQRVLIVQFDLGTVSDVGGSANVWDTVQDLEARKVGTDETSSQKS
jgi:hypothetical protein